jgi:hypothetical protein
VFLSGCVYTPTQEPSEVLSGEEQAMLLMKCTAFNLEYQIMLDKNKQVVGISCIPKFGKTYEMEPTGYKMSNDNIQEVTDEEVLEYIKKYVKPEMLNEPN